MGTKHTKSKQAKVASGASFAIIDEQDRLKAENLTTLAKSLRDYGDTDVTALTDRLDRKESARWGGILDLEKLRKDYHGQSLRGSAEELDNKVVELQAEQEELQKELQEKREEKLQEKLEEELHRSVKELQISVQELDKIYQEKVRAGFLVILGDQSQIGNFCRKLGKKGINGIAVQVEDEEFENTSSRPEALLEFACALPNGYPGYTLIVIGERSAIGELDESWERVDTAIKMIDISEEKSPTSINSLAEKLKGRKGENPKEERKQKSTKRDNLKKQNESQPTRVEVERASLYIAQKSEADFIDGLAFIVRDRTIDVATLLDNVDVVYSERWGCKVLDVDGLRMKFEFIAILGSAAAIGDFRQQLYSKGIGGISVGQPDTQNLLFACTKPQHYPDDVLLVIGDTSAIGPLDNNSWERASAETKMVDTSEKFDELLQRLVDRIERSTHF